LEAQLQRDLAAVELQVECHQWVEWPHMCQLASMEPLLDESNWQCQMADALQRLQRHYRDEQINSLVQQLQERTLRNSEKKQLQQLLQMEKL